MTTTHTPPRKSPARKTDPAVPPVRATRRVPAGAYESPAPLAGAHRTGPRDAPPYVLYNRDMGVDDFVDTLHAAEPVRLIETERKGVAGAFVKDLSRRMEIPAQRMFVILGIPKATAEKKVAAGELLTGSGGRAALGIARLLGMAREIVAHSTAPQARDFDSARWLGRWLETPQPALEGRRPADLLDTPTGLAVVARLLGAIESGAYQ